MIYRAYTRQVGHLRVLETFAVHSPHLVGPQAKHCGHGRSHASSSLPEQIGQGCLISSASASAPTPFAAAPPPRCHLVLLPLSMHCLPGILLMVRAASKSTAAATIPGGFRVPLLLESTAGPHIQYARTPSGGSCAGLRSQHLGTRGRVTYCASLRGRELARSQLRIALGWCNGAREHFIFA